MIFSNLQPPRFSCTDVKDCELMLHYHSHRPGLTDFVIGLLHGLGKLFGTPVEVTVVELKSEGADHDVFNVRWTPATPA
jgi:hypothetical protein